MTTQIYHQIELKFWQVIIPQLSTSRFLGRVLRKALQIKAAFPLFRFGFVALSGSILGALAGVLLFSILN